MDNDFRSRSCGNGRSTQMDIYTNPPPNPKPTTQSIQKLHHFIFIPPTAPATTRHGDVKFSQVKSTNGCSSPSSSSYSSKGWTFTDPELQRKKRVASYKVYVVEGKMKGSLRSFRWTKDRFTQAVHGWR